jgi:hypothetical protein
VYKRQDQCGDDFEREIVTWVENNHKAMDSYRNPTVIKAVLDAFVVDCNMYAIRLVDKHEQWKALNKQAIENTRQRVELLLEDGNIKQKTPIMALTDPLAKRVN